MPDGPADLAHVLGVLGRPVPAETPPDRGSPRRTHVYVLDDIVVKCDDRYGTRSMERERNALAHLARASDLPVPALVADGTLPDGRAWVVLGRLPGEVPADAERMAHLLSPALAAELGSVAVRLHAVPGPPAFGTWTARNPRSMRDESAMRVEALADLARDARIVDPAELDRLLAALASTAEAAASVTAPVLAHRDVQPRNVLVSGDRVTALLDFESSGGGDPAEDFKVLALDWTAPGYAALCGAYAAGGGSLGPLGADRVAHHVLTWVLAIYAYLGGIAPDYLPPARTALDRVLAGERPDVP